jgi:hypothetical protein
VETNTGIIAASLPCLKPVFKRILQSSRGYASRNNYKLQNYGPGTGSRHNQSVVTHIGASKASKGAFSQKNNSDESILSQKNPKGITMTTVVTVNRGSTRPDTSGDRSAWSRTQDIAPERRIDDGI